MARPRFHRAAQKLKESLLTAAAREFAANGYEGASVNQILESASLSKGAFYYYFDDKADLAATVLEHVFGDYLERLSRFDMPKSPEAFWRTIEDFARASVEQLKTMPEQVELLSRMGAAMVRDNHLASHIEPVIRKATLSAKSLWRAGQKMKVIRTDIPLEMLMVLLEGINAALARALIPQDRALNAAELDRLTQLKLDSFYRIARIEPASAAARSPRPKRRKSRSGS